MDIQRIDTTRKPPSGGRISHRGSFVGQQSLIKIITTAISGAKAAKTPLGHTLLTGPSGHGKTTLARLVAQEMDVRVHHITAYALSKPADIISLLNSIQAYDILFIDELHRCKPIIEEILYIAMEDFALDMLLPDGTPLRIQLHPFTLIGATTKPESLTPPLKNRFVYKLHFNEYTPDEKKLLLEEHLKQVGIRITPPTLSSTIATYTSSVPREIHNLSKQLLDRLMAHFGSNDLEISAARREQFWQDLQLQKGGLTPLHQAYLQILETHNRKPVGVKTIAVSLGVHEKTIEEDIEPLLIKMRKIEKTSKGRILC